eukprot:474010_1
MHATLTFCTTSNASIANTGWTKKYNNKIFAALHEWHTQIENRPSLQMVQNVSDKLEFTPLQTCTSVDFNIVAYQQLDDVTKVLISVSRGIAKGLAFSDNSNAIPLSQNAMTLYTSCWKHLSKQDAQCKASLPKFDLRYDIGAQHFNNLRELVSQFGLVIIPQ